MYPAPTSLQLHSNVIYRIPQFSFHSRWQDCWPQLKEAIANAASDELNELLAGVEQESDVNHLPPPVQHTLWKYLNRATFRATPYGSFAAVGMARIGHVAGNGIVVGEQRTHNWPDWMEHDQVDLSFEQITKGDHTFFANGSWYVIGNAIRYLFRNDSNYELAEIDATPITQAILEKCATPKTMEALVNELSETGREGELIANVKALYDDQLLLSSKHPNIIGTDYFERIGFHSDSRRKPYVIAERPCVSGAINSAVLRHLPEMVEKLSRILPSYTSGDLQQFRDAFSSKFGEQEIQLMIALDPELGVGYGRMEADLLSGDVIAKLSNQAAEVPQEELNTTLKKLLPAFSIQPGTVIDLDTIPFPENKNNEPMANTIPVICTVADDLVYYEYGGGSTANSVLGRFTLANEQIHRHCRQMAALEQETNPNVTFFDIAYLTGNRIDNVNRRKQIYDQQLTFLNTDITDTPLQIKDLLVSVVNGKVILRSAANGRRLVPRLASAYNYLFSDLPAFRFLCDLQHQDTHKNLSLRLRDRIEHLPYYPRVQFKNIILSPATWLIKAADINWSAAESRAKALRDYLQQRIPTPLLRTGKGDQTLLFDTSKETELEILVDQIRKEKQLYVEESWLPKLSMAHDKKGGPYLPQLLLTLTHRQQIYEPVIASSFKPADNVILPGDDWLYIQLFCHPIRADEILCNYILPLFQSAGSLIKKYFFIRYQQHGSHLRLRIQLKDAGNYHLLLTGVMNTVRPLLQSGLIADMAIKPYRQETERYGEAYIRQVEQHFYVDSQFTVSILKTGAADELKYQCCLRLLDDVSAAGIFRTDDYTAMIQANSAAFCREHRVGPQSYRQMNTMVKELLSSDSINEEPPGTNSYEAFKISLLGTLYLYPEQERKRIFTALFHMHINRLFANRQRTHEMLIYYAYERRMLRAQKKQAMTAF